MTASDNTNPAQFGRASNIFGSATAFDLGISAPAGKDIYLGNGLNYATSLVIKNGGNIGIGTLSPSHLLHVAGTIGAEEVVVSSTGADYVFDPDYRLAPLGEVADFIRRNHHLPDVPSAEEGQEKGVNVGEIQAKLLAKIEELTLHMIRAEERSDRLERANRGLRERMERIEAGATSGAQ